MAEVRVWAPRATTMSLVVEMPSGGGRSTWTIPMVRDTSGDTPISGPSTDWWRVEAVSPEIPPAHDGNRPDIRYGFSVDGGPPRADPRAVRLPDGVHGLAALGGPRHQWTDSDWAGRSVRGSVLYELHIGTFTPEGTFDAALGHLDHLVDLGIDMVEVMPVNAFNGTHGWGYDGVGWYAVHEPYGGPDGLARFVDGCHRRGLGVILDVVYNHLGPSGNHLPEFGPYLGDGDTTWGSAMNLSGSDSDDVRDFIVANALWWFGDLHLDGLRLDAVHALSDRSAIHLLEELATETEILAADVRRPLSLIAESDLNDPRLILPREAGGYGLTAQWDDDVHHALHSAVSGEDQGYYADFADPSALAKVLRGGFFHDGTYSSFRGRRHGRPIPATVPTTALVAFTCNHDQIGNRAAGDRPSHYLPPGLLAAKAAIIVLSPFTPMLFMGEEWAATTPFAFFSSHPEPELAQATRDGRRAEFADHGWTGHVPDPQAPGTFADSHLDWSEATSPEHRRMVDFYRSLIALRKREPDFRGDDFDSVTTDHGPGWFAMHRGSWTVLLATSPDSVRLPFPLRPELWWHPTAPGTDITESAGHNVIVGRRIDQVRYS